MFFSVIGLSFNFIGTLLVAFSIKKGELDQHLSTERRIRITSLKKYRE